MARAKRTARAEARRRYRAQLASDPEEEFEDGDAAPQPGQRGPTPPKPALPARPGFRSAFGQAFRPLDLRGDLAYLPRLILHRSVIVPALVTLTATVTYVAIVAPRPAGQLTPVDAAVIYVFQIFVLPPPIGASFLAGFLAQRASWLGGIIVSFVATICYVSTVGVTANAPATAASDAAVAMSSQPAVFVLEALFFSLPMGALFAAMAAWYKRFLNLANPNRMQRPVRDNGRSRGGRNARSR